MTLAPGHAPWREPRILSTLFLVFLAGAASGALSMHFGLNNKLRRVVSIAPRESGCFGCRCLPSLSVW